MYLLKLALRPWRIAPFSQLFSAAAVGFLLLLLGFLFWMQKGLKPVLVRLQGEQVITAYLDPSVQGKDEEKILEKVRLEMGNAHSGTSSLPDIKLVSSVRFIELLKMEYPDLGRELENLGGDASKLIPRYISIVGVLTSSALDRVKIIPGIENAESSKDRYRHVVGAFLVLRWVVRILMGGVALALLTGLIHLSRMNSFLHKDALALLRFWGGGGMTLISPAAISGLLVGFLGGMIACGGWMTLGQWLIHHLRSLSVMLRGMPFPHPSAGLVLFATGGIIGLIAGFLGSLFASQSNENRGHWT